MTEPAPTQEDMKQGMDVAAAATEAAQNEKTPDGARKAAKRAVRQSAPASFELSDDDCERIANYVVDQMESRGAFDAPPERLQPAPAPAAEQPGPIAAPDQQQTPQEAPRPTTFAERFRGKRG